MIELQQGGNAAVDGTDATIRFEWSVPQGRDVEADASAYLLTANGRVRGDADMVFYNQPAGADGAVSFVADDGGRGRFQLDLARIPQSIERIVFCVTLHEAQSKRQTLALLDGATISVDAAGSAIRYRPALVAASEAAMTFGELYRRNGQWKFRAVGQGFNGGLAPLAGSFGIDVAEAAAPPEAPPPPPPPPPPPVRLSKVTLDKPGQTVSLEKKGAAFGEIGVNLNWSRGRKGYFGGGTAIDLDLGCLYELQDGSLGVVQALGNAFGSFEDDPYIALSADDRTGDVSQGETMRINGRHWSDIRRVMVFANIYDGVPNWQQTDGVITVAMPDQPPIEVRMTEGRNDRRVCGVVMIENDAGRLKATRVVEYFRDQQKLDQRFEWGLRWVAGRKD
ncbi:TerD family protein [Sphingomonas sp. NFX23]|uniref:TerD family protein n=1 Tax=Sphingomonas sp. NFX23 TaxID=2819532 RepID=UPI003CE70455